jgi:hypothetical protein
MSAIDDLKASDTLQFDSISYHQHVSIPFVPDADVTTFPFCVPKDPGELAFTLDSNQLALPIASQTFRFTGTANGNQVTWDIDQPLDVWYLGAHLSRVHGQIVTSVDNVTPSLGTDCSGAQRVQTVTLTTVGTGNAVSIDTDPDVASATISNIYAQEVRCLETLPRVFFDVRFTADKSQDACGHYFQIQGSTVRFTAWVENLNAVGAVTSITYTWTHSAGVTVNGPSDQATIEVVLNNPGRISLTCQVVVSTTVEAGTNQSTANVTVLTTDEEAQWRLGCHLVWLVRRLPPLLFPGDPALEWLRPEIAAVPGASTLHGLYLLRASAERIAEAASSLARQTTSVIEQREPQIKLSREEDPNAN